MRTVSIGVAAAFLFASTLGTLAAPVPSSTDGAQYKSHLLLIKAENKKKAKASGKKKAKKASKRKGKRAGPGKCGTGKYWKKGKCLSASDKKVR